MRTYQTVDFDGWNNRIENGELTLASELRAGARFRSVSGSVFTVIDHLSNGCLYVLREDGTHDYFAGCAYVEVLTK